MAGKRKSEMTVRVSRDSGRTYSDSKTVKPAKTPEISSSWPPCQCPTHAEKRPS